MVEKEEEERDMIFEETSSTVSKAFFQAGKRAAEEGSVGCVCCFVFL